MKLKITDIELSPVHTKKDNYKYNNIRGNSNTIPPKFSLGGSCGLMVRDWDS